MSTCRISAATSTSHGHKLYGRPARRALCKYEHLAAMAPFTAAARYREVFEDHITYGDPPHRFEAGTPSIVQAIGLGLRSTYIASVARTASASTSRSSWAMRTSGCARSTRCASSAPQKARARCLLRDKGSTRRCRHHYRPRRCRVRAGTHCVMPLLKRFGMTATCRASFAMYNTKAEVDRWRRRSSRRRSFFA